MNSTGSFCPPLIHCSPPLILIPDSKWGPTTIKSNAVNGNRQWKPEPISDSPGPTSRTQPQPQLIDNTCRDNEMRPDLTLTTRPVNQHESNQRRFQASIRLRVHGGYSPHDLRQRVQPSDGEANPTNQMQQWTQT